MGELGKQGRPSSKAGPAVRPPIIYFNIGWMKDYAGPINSDKTKGGHGYLKTHPHGGEASNFLISKADTVRGYRPPGAGEKTNITKMGAANGDGQIDGALVVWLAKEPNSHRALIVGWYLHATVFRVARDGGTSLPDGERVCYSAEAAARDAVLLPPSMRTFQVESSRTKPGAGFGQKPTWYGAEEVNKRVWNYITNFKSERPIRTRHPQAKPPKNFDPELRRKVEKAAVAHAINYYKELYGSAYEVKSVEPYAKGWDLEVFVGPDPLLVEVKGLMSSENLVCELTPNEYEQMMLPKHRARYIIYVVNNAVAELPAIPVASIFEHAGGEKWETADGRKLIVQPKIAAVLRCL